ncbi:MAG: dihydropteroate synthase [Bacteriovorax sp.]
MGVINITPDSFSDAGSLFQNGEELKKLLKQFKKIPALVYDFGFESTAPMNSAISSAEEKSRFDNIFDALAGIDLSGKWISFDTYRPESYLYFEEKFQMRYKGCGFIFNDISGVVDSDLLNLLKSKRYQKNFYYVLGSTHIPSRDKVLDHMNYIHEGDIVEQTGDCFLNGIPKLVECGLKEKIILDPCFGFSKSYEQNWELLTRFDDLARILKASGHTYPWLVGVSKKSFLRRALPESSDPFNDAEILHAKIIEDMILKNCGQLIWRAHDPFLVESIYSRAATQS